MQNDNLQQPVFMIYLSEKIYLIHNLKSNKIISIERNPLRLYHSSQEIFSKIEIYKSIKLYCILGIITINECYYLLYVKMAELVGELNNKDKNIYLIKEAELLPISEDNPDEEDLLIIENIKNLLKTGFFYSFTHDLSNSIQKQSRNKSNNFFENIDKNYMWNYNISKEFFENKIDPCFYTYLIHGYVGIMNNTLKENNKKFTTVIISRRNSQNPFSSQLSKGINEEGNVANFVETEQILIYDNYVFSFIYLRGNAPVHFEHSDKHIRIIKTPDEQNYLFHKHIEFIKLNYKTILFINLFNRNDISEQLITKSLENNFRMNQLNNLNISCGYNICELEDLSNLNEVERKVGMFTSSIEKFLIESSFFCQEMNNRKIIAEQSGVLRIVCYDSLEKSNLILTNISSKIIEYFVNFC